MTRTVPEALQALAGLYEERNALYGDNYKSFGLAMQGLFPNGLMIKTHDDWNRLGVFVQVVAKLTRYSNLWGKGGHVDSLDDLTVYTQMLQELDKEIKEGADFGEFLNGLISGATPRPAPTSPPVRPGWPIQDVGGRE